jgi:hypothetical protein
MIRLRRLETDELAQAGKAVGVHLGDVGDQRADVVDKRSMFGKEALLVLRGQDGLRQPSRGSS